MATDDLTPFLAARHEFDHAFGNLARGKRNWQVVAGVALTLLTLVIVAYVRLTFTSRITPYVVEVDALGRAVAFGPALPLKATDRRVVIAQLTQFIRNVRAVVPHAVVQRDVLRQAYAFVDQRGAAFLNAYFADPANDPRLLGTETLRTVEVGSVLPVPGSSGEPVSSAIPTVWKLTWTETTVPTTAGGITRTAAWEGYLTIHLIPPTRADRIHDNPLGLYVSTIVWTEITARVSPTPAPATSPFASPLPSGVPNP